MSGFETLNASRIHGQVSLGAYHDSITANGLDSRVRIVGEICCDLTVVEGVVPL